MVVFHITEFSKNVFIWMPILSGSLDVLQMSMLTLLEIYHQKSPRLIARMFLAPWRV